MPADPVDLLESAWGIIANAGGGDWTTQTAEWQEAARRWRDSYHEAIKPFIGQGCTFFQNLGGLQPKSQLEVDLEHDAAGRVERTSRR
jgi:hypothetical protein